jgi:undecaprenyl-diphosphatase
LSTSLTSRTSYAEPLVFSSSNLAISSNLALVPNSFFASNNAVPEWFEIFILALIEGVTEFLPISSTGHMLLAQNWLKYKQDELFLSVVQSGAVLAVLLVFATRLKTIFREWHVAENRQFIYKLGAAFFLTAVGGLILKKFNFELPESPVPVALATLIGGVLILWIESSIRGKNLRDTVTWPVALTIGVGQLLAVIFPGLSRSGTTIMIALALGTARRPATEFSFLLGIPTLLSAAALQIVETIRHPETAANVDWLMIAWGTAVAAVTAFISVKWLLKFVQSHTFNGFAWYRIGLGLIILALVSVPG